MSDHDARMKMLREMLEACSIPPNKVYDALEASLDAYDDMKRQLEGEFSRGAEAMREKIAEAFDDRVMTESGRCDDLYRVVMDLSVTTADEKENEDG